MKKYRSTNLIEYRETRFEHLTMKTFVEFRSLAGLEYLFTSLTAFLAIGALVKLFVGSRIIPLSDAFTNIVVLHGA